MEILYAIVVLLASGIGAISGIGGGVIIKPVLDALSPYDTFVIGILSSFSILAMSLTSVFRHAINKTSFNSISTILLGVGSIVGGFAGDVVFSAVRSETNDHIVKVSQESILVVLVIFVLIYMHFIKNKINCSLHIKNWLLILAIGIILGAISTYTGVGGGPINLAVLCLFFSMDIKSATVNSLVLILFSQIAKIVRTVIIGGFVNSQIPWGVLIAMVIAGVIGGLAGTAIHGKIKDKHILGVYSCTLFSIIIINVYNIVSNI